MQDTIRAYIAGFLDGDGSIHFQLVRRRDYAYGYQIRVSVCFYQSTRGKAGLESTVTPERFLESAKLVDAFATLNYSKRKLIDAECVETYLNGKGLLVPVTTEALESERRDHEQLPVTVNLVP